MIVIRPMRDEEYAAYLNYFIADYAAEIATNYALSPEAALAQAQREIAEDLPDGVNTHGQALRCLFDEIDGTEKRVGYLWYKPDAEIRSAGDNPRARRLYEVTGFRVTGINMSKNIAAD